MNQDIEAKTGEDCVFELWIIVHDDCDYSNIWKKTSSSAYDILPVKPELSWSVETSIIHAVVVPGVLITSLFALVLRRALATHNGLSLTRRDSFKLACTTSIKAELLFFDFYRSRLLLDLAWPLQEVLFQSSGETRRIQSDARH